MVRGEKALDQQEIDFGIFFDIEGAFNNTSYDSMCAALAKRGVDYTIIRWIRANLEGWLATATVGGLSWSAGVSRGCPQGGVLSPLIWCLANNELLARLNEGGVYTQGYAGDICLLAVGKFPNTVSGLIQWVHGATSSVHRLIPTKPGLLLLQEEGNSQGSLNHAYLG